MSIANIRKYREQINKAERTNLFHEQNIREYFYTLLKNYTDQENLEIDREPREEGIDGRNIYIDGRIKKDGAPIGWIENKDSKDNLTVEIEKKIQKNYSTVNTIFENSKHLFLYQDGLCVEHIDMNDDKALHQVLLKFVTYKSKEITKFFDALDRLKEILPTLASDLREYFASEIHSNKQFKDNLNEFTEMCKTSINKNVTKEQAIEIVIQHMLTKDIFVLIFTNPYFHESNIISKSITNILGTVIQKSRDVHNKIEIYFETLKLYISKIDKEDKQDILKVFYQNFYTALNPKNADTKGVVYTPKQIVKFMVSATNDLLYEHFTKNLSSRNVNILDPCTGTGLFMAEIIKNINDTDLPYKYQHELFANEIEVMPYYIANLNIENEYFDKMRSYIEFQNICLIDTLEFQIPKFGGVFVGIGGFSDENVDRAISQYEKPISVVIGNPPYNANQQSENDNNKNKIYEQVDAKIKDTYISRSKAQKTKQFDMYKRFIRWASDRIQGTGIVAFITNNSYLDSRQDDGFRLCAQEEFDYIYIVDLKGNARKSDKREGQSVFNIMVGTAIMFLIKNAEVKMKGKAEIYYHNLGDFLKREEKRHLLGALNIRKIDFTRILPTEHGQWLNISDNDFDSHPPLISKAVKNQKNITEVKGGGFGEEKSIFKLFSLGVCTNRDNWAYDFDKEQLEKKTNKLIEVYDEEREKYAGIDYLDFDKNRDLNYSIKWSRDLKKDLQSNRNIVFDKSNIRTILYKTFVNKYIYFDDGMVDVRGLNPKIFPNEMSDNISMVIGFNAPERHSDVLAVKNLVDINFIKPGAVYSVPLYSYDEAGNKVCNVTDWGLRLFRERYSENPPAPLLPQRVLPRVAGGVRAVGVSDSEASIVTLGNTRRSDKGRFGGVADSDSENPPPPLSGGVSESQSRIPYIPYNIKLNERAKELRKNQTPAESKIWNNVLRNKCFDDLKFTRQKPILDFIVDFYCAELLLAIEIDGESHYSEQGIVYDEERSNKIDFYNIKILRYTNDEVMNNIESVNTDLISQIGLRRNELSCNKYEVGSTHHGNGSVGFPNQLLTPPDKGAGGFPHPTKGDAGFSESEPETPPNLPLSREASESETPPDKGAGGFSESESKITPQRIFAYCHAVLSSREYQTKYMDNLKMDYPRIPLYDNFNKYADIGERLIYLQTNFENVEGYIDLEIKRDDTYLPDGITNPNKSGYFPTLRVDKKNCVIILDNKNEIANIPSRVFEYQIGNRSAVEWVCEYYKPKKLNPKKERHHQTLIDEGLDYYNWQQLRENLFDLLPRMVNVSLQILDLLDDLGK